MVGLHPDQDSIQALLQAKEPSSKSELHSLILFVTFYAKFIPNMSTMLRPLYALLNQDVSLLSLGPLTALQEATETRKNPILRRVLIYILNGWPDVVPNEGLRPFHRSKMRMDEGKRYFHDQEIYSPETRVEEIEHSIREIYPSELDPKPNREGLTTLTEFRVDNHSPFVPGVESYEKDISPESHPPQRVEIPLEIRSNRDAKPKALIGQESAPKPPPPLKDHTCQNRGSGILGRGRKLEKLESATTQGPMGRRAGPSLQFETLATNITFVRSVFTMSSEMCFKVAISFETLATNITFVRSMFIMTGEMSFKGAISFEALATNITFVRSVFTMTNEMRFKIALFFKTFGTKVTFVRSVFTMTEEMRFKDAF
uniref:Uncharacterized protein n=1 Tax=Timema douglasi TaxID=61478 RepID=A0A7R8VWJ0_TIMDO|nr:unnamed protein product [Timema douglasi]